MHTQCKIQRQPSGFISEASSGSVDKHPLLTMFLCPVFIMGLTAVTSVLPQVIVMAMTSSKRLCPEDKDDIQR